MIKKICIAGNFNIAIESTQFILNNYTNHKLYAVLNHSDKGKDAFQKSFKKFCLKKKIEILTLEDCYKIKNLIFISLHFDKIINTNNFKSKKLFNLHFSLLPSYKGMHTASFPIILGEKFSGVTMHIIDNGIDTGDIISQKKFKIDLNDTARDLFFKYIYHGTILFKETINSLIQNNYILSKQSFNDSSYFSKSSIDFANLKIDFNKTAFELHSQVRAYIFEEYQLPKIKGYYVNRSKITKLKSKFKPGKIIINNKKILQLSTIDYDIIFSKKQKK